MTEVKALTTSIIVLHPTEPEVLCVRHPDFGVWMFPGGHVDPGEAPHSAALREIEEEVGLVVRLIDLSELPRWSDGRNARLPQPLAIIEEALPGGGCYVDMIYVGLANDTRLILANEIQAAEWLDVSRLRTKATPYPIEELTVHVLGLVDELRSMWRR